MKKNKEIKIPNRDTVFIPMNSILHSKIYFLNNCFVVHYTNCCYEKIIFI